MAFLTLVRHGESEWNKKGLWTGLTDIPLSEKGFDEARDAGRKLQDIHFDKAFCSPLIRAKQTLEEMKKILLFAGETIENKALNERDYGIMTGKNKWQIQKEIGEDAFKNLRRSWNHPIKNGETLKDVYNRVIPYYKTHIMPLLQNGENILVVAHGNSLRALVKYLDAISDENIAHLEIPTGEVYVYTIKNDGSVSAREIRK